MKANRKICWKESFRAKKGNPEGSMPGDQKFVKNGDLTVAQYVAEAGKELGKDMKSSGNDPLRSRAKESKRKKKTSRLK